MLKYGRLALVDGLSGTLGHVADPHGSLALAAGKDVVAGETARRTPRPQSATGKPSSSSSTRPARRRLVKPDTAIDEGVIQA